MNIALPEWPPSSCVQQIGRAFTRTVRNCLYRVRASTTAISRAKVFRKTPVVACALLPNTTGVTNHREIKPDGFEPGERGGRANTAVSRRNPSVRDNSPGEGRPLKYAPRVLLAATLSEPQSAILC